MKVSLGCCPQVRAASQQHLEAGMRKLLLGGLPEQR